MKNTKSLFYLLMAGLLFTACEDDTETPNPVVDPIIPSARVLVSCEGSFGVSNASLSAYDADSKTVSNGVFESVNGYAIGDVLQSIAGQGDDIYLVVNNSSQIHPLSSESLEAATPITGLTSPRMLLPVGGDKAYVSNLFVDDVQVVDLAAGTVSGTIDVGGSSEGMVLVGQEAFVTRNTGSKVMVVNTATDAVIDSIEVGQGPKDLVVDANGDIWMLGFAYDASWNIVDGRISKIDPETRSLVSTYAIPEPWGYKMELRIDGNEERLFILNDKVYTMDITGSAISSTAFIDNGHSNYGLGVDPNSGDIYLGYAPDFTSDGMVYRYDDQGAAIDTFSVGIAPNFFYFGE